MIGQSSNPEKTGYLIDFNARIARELMMGNSDFCIQFDLYIILINIIQDAMNKQSKTDCKFPISKENKDILAELGFEIYDQISHCIQVEGIYHTISW